MSNPTLLAQDTPWDGFTMDSLVEALLNMRGLTSDTTKDLSLAETADTNDALRFVREALDDLFARFPNLCSRRQYSVAWTSGDHSILLPANFGSIEQVSLGNIPVAPLSDADYARILRPDENGGGVLGEGEAWVPWGYRLVGMADAASPATGADVRAVLRLYPTPTGVSATATLLVDYVAVAPKVATTTQVIPILRPLQRWVKAAAAVLWASERNDMALGSAQERTLARIEESLYSWFDGMRDRPSRATTRRPVVRRLDRYGRN